jgi:periplasmic protein TonB
MRDHQGVDMTDITEINWVATPRARDENALNSAGLSVRQRKLLSMLITPLSTSELAERVKVPVAEVEVALRRFATNGLVSSDSIAATSPLSARPSTFAPGGYNSPAAASTITPAAASAVAAPSMAATTLTGFGGAAAANTVTASASNVAANAANAAAAAGAAFPLNAGSTPAASGSAPNRMPLYIGGVAVTLIAAGIWFFTRGSTAPTAPTPASPVVAATPAPEQNPSTAASAKVGTTAAAAASNSDLPAGNTAAVGANTIVTTPRPATPAEAAKALTPKEIAAKDAAAKEAAKAAAATAAQRNAAAAAGATPVVPAPAAATAPQPAAASAASAASAAAATPAPAPNASAAATTPSANATTAATPAATTPAPAPTAVAAAPAARPATPAAAREGRLLERVEPLFPRNTDAESGTVRARIAVNGSGAVTGVEILEANPPRVFDRNVRSALQQWKYEATGEASSKLVEISFKR